jgi:hypothetical protein
MSYKQDSKEKSREELWRHAISAVTVARKSSRVLNLEYLETLWNYAWDDVLSHVLDVSKERHRIAEYFANWAEYSESCYSEKSPKDLRVAYFSGPEPENDLRILLSLGIRIENVWAFEADKDTYSKALEKARENFPFLKIFPGSLGDFFKTNHLTFDIIYLDFTGSLVARSLKTLSVLHAAFDEQALSDLSVLVVNSCEPDATQDNCDFLSAYYYFQPMVECSVYGESPHQEDNKLISWFSEPASAHGYEPKHLSQMAANNMRGVYSAFATSYPLYYSNFISPTLRFLRNGSLRKQLFSSDKTTHKEAFDRMSDVSSLLSEFMPDSESNDDNIISGDRIFNADSFPFWNFIDSLQSMGGALGQYWFNEFSKSKDGASVLDAAKFRESLAETLSGYDGLLSDNIKKEIRRVNSAIPDARGGLFCDVPMAHLWLELGLNQLGAPYHSNLNNHRRWTYKAKVRQMHLDAFTFDRCRSMYDYLPMVDMYGDVLENLLPQLIIRCCIDAIGKQIRWPLPNLYYGSNIACINDDIKGADFGELEARVEIQA